MTVGTTSASATTHAATSHDAKDRQVSLQQLKKIAGKTAAKRSSALRAQSAPASDDVETPAQPTSGLGSTGPCGVSAKTHDNPNEGDANRRILVYSPTGDKSAPVTGGKCSAKKRPVALIVHGLGVNLDADITGSSLLMKGAIDHLVSQGNVVVFPTWNPLEFDDLPGQMKSLEKSVVASQKFAPRGDFTRLGIVGHSMGGGAVPYLATHAASHHWGTKALWIHAIAPYFSFGVGTGKYSIPSHARVLVESFDHDQWVDTRNAIDQYKSYKIPKSRKQFVVVRSEARGNRSLDAIHMVPNSLITPDDSMKYFGVYRNSDAMASSALTGKNCSTDLSFMGCWSDGKPAKPAISTDSPRDIGPKADITRILPVLGTGECNDPNNPRAKLCGPSHITS